MFAHKVTAEAQVEALLYLFDIGEGTGEGFVVTHVGDNDIAA